MCFLCHWKIWQLAIFVWLFVPSFIHHSPLARHSIPFAGRALQEQSKASAPVRALIENTNSIQDFLALASSLFFHSYRLWGLLKLGNMSCADVPRSPESIYCKGVTSVWCPNSDAGTTSLALMLAKLFCQNPPTTGMSTQCRLSHHLLCKVFSILEEVRLLGSSTPDRMWWDKGHSYPIMGGHFSKNFLKCLLPFWQRSLAVNELRTHAGEPCVFLCRENRFPALACSFRSIATTEIWMWDFLQGRDFIPKPDNSAIACHILEFYPSQTYYLLLLIFSC